ncbi:hypothetical protein DY000_02040188 [Brassica cretica]|uniref:Uncharacterized protein n=1 Tax=Brassica cretica TaxID=69181 RepID=A0ABQ7BJ77_BRACR|nr:hypothetical protein DY000_02040188 [Brassica cretica]
MLPKLKPCVSSAVCTCGGTGTMSLALYQAWHLLSAYLTSSNGQDPVVVPTTEVPIIRKGPTTRSGSRVIRAGFAKAVQELLAQEQTGFKQLLIQELADLKLEDTSEPLEVPDSFHSSQYNHKQEKARPEPSIRAKTNPQNVRPTTPSRAYNILVSELKFLNLHSLIKLPIPLCPQLLADNEELRASLRAITAELAQLRQGGRPNGPRPPGRNQPDPHDTDSDADSTDDTRSQDEDRPNRGGRRNTRGRWAQISGTSGKLGFS